MARALSAIWCLVYRVLYLLQFLKRTSSSPITRKLLKYSINEFEMCKFASSFHCRLLYIYNKYFNLACSVQKNNIQVQYHSTWQLLNIVKKTNASANFSRKNQVGHYGILTLVNSKMIGENLKWTHGSKWNKISSIIICQWKMRKGKANGTTINKQTTEKQGQLLFHNWLASK